MLINLKTNIDTIRCQLDSGCFAFFNKQQDGTFINATRPDNGCRDRMLDFMLTQLGRNEDPRVKAGNQFYDGYANWITSTINLTRTCIAYHPPRNKFDVAKFEKYLKIAGYDKPHNVHVLFNGQVILFDADDADWLNSTMSLSALLGLMKFSAANWSIFQDAGFHAVIDLSTGKPDQTASEEYLRIVLKIDTSKWMLGRDEKYCRNVGQFGNFGGQMHGCGGFANQYRNNWHFKEQIDALIAANKKGLTAKVIDAVQNQVKRTIAASRDAQGRFAKKAA